MLTSSDPVHTLESTEKLAAPNLAQQLQTSHEQHSRFGTRLRVVHKAEAAITCHHTQLGALLKRAAGAIYFKESVNVCDSSCAFGCFHIACPVQMFTDPRQNLQTGRQALFFRNVLCIAFFRSIQLSEEGFNAEKNQVVTAGQTGANKMTFLGMYAKSGVDLTSRILHQANLQF